MMPQLRRRPREKSENDIRRLSRRAGPPCTSDDAHRRGSRQLLTPRATRLRAARRQLFPGTMNGIMSRAGFTLFATALGDCAVAWNGVGLFGVWLPEATPARLRSRVERRFPHLREAAAPAAVAEARDAITRLLDGQR